MRNKDTILLENAYQQILENETADLGVMKDDNGVKRSVNKVIEFVEQNKNKYYKANFPIKELEHNLEWWDKQNQADPEKSTARMMKADTSFPLLVIKNDRYGLSVADGLNRLKKAKDIEKKTTVNIYLVPEEDIPDTTIVK